MKIRKVLAGAATVLAAAAIGLVNPAPAQAIVSGQPGYQYISNPANSASGYIVQFACKINVGINPTWNAGEGQGIPACGDPSTLSGGLREPTWLWIGPGWCATRSVVNEADGVPLGYQNLAAGSGHWFQVQQTYLTQSYHTVAKAWTGAGCPASGPAWVDNNPPGLPGYPYQW